MDDPSWERYGFIGGIVAGLILAVREISAWFKSTDGSAKQKVITPADVRELVLTLSNKVDLMNMQFVAFREEENRVHAKLESELRDAFMCVERHSGGGRNDP